MKTNLPSNTAVRSFGSPQGEQRNRAVVVPRGGYFVCEAIIEDIAGRLGKPVEEIREVNMCTRENAVTPWEQPMEYYNVAGTSMVAVDMLWKKLKQDLAAAILGTWRLVDAKYAEREEACKAFNEKHRWRKRGISAVPLAYGHCYAYAAGTGALVNIFGHWVSSCRQ
eukprot:Skav225603  [mRNA]  locus=scaffold3871:3194:6392:+ [translate_table: standard]